MKLHDPLKVRIGYGNLVLHVSLVFGLSRSGRGYESLRYLDPLGLVTSSTTPKLSCHRLLGLAAYRPLGTEVRNLSDSDLPVCITKRHDAIQ